MAPDAFDNGDSKSESWHGAKKIREVIMVNKSVCALLSVMENRVVLAAALKNNKNNLKNVEAENFLKLCLKYRTFSTYAFNFVKLN